MAHTPHFIRIFTFTPTLPGWLVRQASNSHCACSTILPSNHMLKSHRHASLMYKMSNLHMDLLPSLGCHPDWLLNSCSLQTTYSVDTFTSCHHPYLHLQHYPCCRWIGLTNNQQCTWWQGYSPSSEHTGSYLIMAQLRCPPIFGSSQLQLLLAVHCYHWSCLQQGGTRRAVKKSMRLPAQRKGYGSQKWQTKLATDHVPLNHCRQEKDQPEWGVEWFHTFALKLIWLFSHPWECHEFPWFGYHTT